MPAGGIGGRRGGCYNRPARVGAPVDPQILFIVLVIAFLILSLGVHEAAHAWVASLCGDDTAKRMGRLTLNPVPHIDPIMTIALPAILAWSTSGRFIFGGAKPVPVNPNNLRHPLRDMMFVAIAGPLSNFLQAIFYMVVLKSLVSFTDLGEESLARRVIGMTVQFNLVLTIFNLIPVPPLDGSRVMAYLLPSGLRETYVGLERFGMILVFALLFTGALGAILNATILPMVQAVDFITGGKW